MLKFLNYLIVVIFCLTTTLLFSANRCRTVFITHPFTTQSNPVYDSEEYLKIVDELPLSITSRNLDEPEKIWTVHIKSQVDTAKVLMNLIRLVKLENDRTIGSDLSLDDSLYVITQLILPKLDTFKSIDITTEKNRFYELLFDVLGMKTISIFTNIIEDSSLELTNLLTLWSSDSIDKIYKDFKSLTTKVQQARAVNDIDSIEKIFKLNETSELETLFPEYYKYYHKQLQSFKERRELLITTQTPPFNDIGTLYFPTAPESYRQSINSFFSQYLAEVEKFNLQDKPMDIAKKTFTTLDRLILYTHRLLHVFKNKQIDSNFITDNQRGSLVKSLSNSVQKLMKVREALYTLSDQIQKDLETSFTSDKIYERISSRIKSTTLPDLIASGAFSTITQPVFDAFEVYLNATYGSLLKGAVASGDDFKLDKKAYIVAYLDPNFKTSDISEEEDEDEIKVDDSTASTTNQDSSPIYTYISSFEFLNNEVYLRYLTQKYGPDFTKTLIEALSTK